MDFLFCGEKQEDGELAAFFQAASKPKPKIDGYDYLIIDLFNDCMFNNGMGLDIKYDKLKDYIKHYKLELFETSKLIDVIFSKYKQEIK